MEFLKGCCRPLLWTLLFSPLSFVVAQEKELPQLETEIAIYIWAKGSFGDELDKDGNIISRYTPPEVKFANADGQVVDMNVFPGRRTPFQKYKGVAQIQFFREFLVKGEEEPRRYPVGQVVLPETTRSALLILYPKDKAMTVFTVYPLLDVSENIPPGKALVYNTCAFEIGAQLGKVAGFQVAPQRSILADLKPDQHSFLQFQFWVRNGGDWSKAYSSKKAIHPESSVILIIHPKQNSDGSINPRLVDLLTLSAT
ncbi:MAG: hypothetical protein HOD72_09395 [Opitutae bacterium]|nr:hypothetical protein [Opitutae bacterium]